MFRASDTYIEKESSINEQIDRMRHSATRALLERDDVIIVASVSCIYGIGSVETYTAMTFSIKAGEIARPAPAHRRPRRPAIQALRRRFFTRRVPRARRHDRNLPRPLRGPRLARRLLRRRGGKDRGIRPAHRQEDAGPALREGLRQLALCHAAPDAPAGHRRHQVRTQAAPARTQRRRPLPRSAAARTAHPASTSK